MCIYYDYNYIRYKIYFYFTNFNLFFSQELHSSHPKIAVGRVAGPTAPSPAMWVTASYQY